MSGKGDKQRPRQVSQDEYAARWDAVFAPRWASDSDVPDSGFLDDGDDTPVDTIVPSERAERNRLKREREDREHQEKLQRLGLAK